MYVDDKTDYPYVNWELAWCYINYVVLGFMHMMMHTTVATLFILSLTVVFACDAGYEWNSTSGDCTKCPVTTYKNESGNASCTVCQANSENGIAGERQCYCSLGFSHNVDGVCTQCADCSFKVLFQIRVDIPDPVLKDKIPYVLAFFSHAFAVAPSAIKIVQINIATDGGFSLFRTIVTGTNSTISFVSAHVVSDAFKSAVFDELKQFGLTTEPDIYIETQPADNVALISFFLIFFSVVIGIGCLLFCYGILCHKRPVAARERGKNPASLESGILADMRINLVGPYRQLTEFD
jgi:hypothetical protein